LGAPPEQPAKSKVPHTPTRTSLTALMAALPADVGPDGALNVAAPRRAIGAAVMKRSLGRGGWPLPGLHEGVCGVTRRARRHLLSQPSFTRHKPEATRSDEERNILSCFATGAGGRHASVAAFRRYGRPDLPMRASLLTAYSLGHVNSQLFLRQPATPSISPVARQAHLLRRQARRDTCSRDPGPLDVLQGV